MAKNENAPSYVFHPRLFNPLFWHLRKYLGDESIRYIFIYGGSSAAKTYTTTQALSIEQLERPCNIAVFRKESTTLDDTVYGDFKNVSKTLQLSQLHTFQEKELKVANGQYVKFKGLDDPEKIKGISDYKYVYLNELSKFDEEDLDEARRRLRGTPGQKIIADWNPISEEHWIKKMLDEDTWHSLPIEVKGVPVQYTSLDPERSFVKRNAAGDAILIRTTYKDNYYVVGHPNGVDGFKDVHVLNEFERMKRVNYDDYLVYALAEWGTVKTGTEFFDFFTRSTHVRPLTPNTSNAVNLWFDFNNLPYSTCLVVQVDISSAGTIIRFLDEICLTPPTNTIEDISDEFFYRYPWAKMGFYVIDPAGRAKGMRKSRDESFSYEDQIISSFSRIMHNNSDMTPSTHPPKANRRSACRELFSGEYKVTVLIDPKCVNLITDLEKLLIATDGGYVKVKETNKRTKQTYEKLGHCADAMIYGFSSLFEDKFF